MFSKNKKKKHFPKNKKIKAKKCCEKNYLTALFYKDVFNEKKRYEPSIKMISHATWVKGKEKREKEK